MDMTRCDEGGRCTDQMLCLDGWIEGCIESRNVWIDDKLYRHFWP
jgi:hypothetical protein